MSKLTFLKFARYIILLSNVLKTFEESVKARKKLENWYPKKRAKSFENLKLANCFSWNSKDGIQKFDSELAKSRI